MTVNKENKGRERERVEWPTHQSTIVGAAPKLKVVKPSTLSPTPTVLLCFAYSSNSIIINIFFFRKTGKKKHRFFLSKTCMFLHLWASDEKRSSLSLPFSHFRSNPLCVFSFTEGIVFPPISKFMAAPPARARADYDYLIKLLLIGDSGKLPFSSNSFKIEQKFKLVIIMIDGSFIRNFWFSYLLAIFLFFSMISELGFVLNC